MYNKLYINVPILLIYSSTLLQRRSGARHILSVLISTHVDVISILDILCNKWWLPIVVPELK